MTTYPGKRIFDQAGGGGGRPPPGKQSKVQRTCQGGAASEDDITNYIEFAKQSESICTAGHPELYAYLWLDETNPYYDVGTPILPTHLQWWDTALLARPNPAQMTQFIRNELTLWKELLYTFKTVTANRAGNNRFFFKDGSPVEDNCFDEPDPDPDEIGVLSNYMIVKIEMNQNQLDMKAAYTAPPGASDANVIICGANQLINLPPREAQLRQEAAERTEVADELRFRIDDVIMNNPNMNPASSLAHDVARWTAEQVQAAGDAIQLTATADHIQQIIQDGGNVPAQIDLQNPDLLIGGSLLGSYMPMVEVTIMATEPLDPVSVPCDDAPVGETLYDTGIVITVPAMMLWGVLAGEPESHPIWRPTLSMGRIARSNGMPFELLPAPAAPAGASGSAMGARRLLQAIASMPEAEREIAPFESCLVDIEYSNCPSYSQDEYQCTNNGCTYIMDTGACIGGKYSNSCAIAECSFIGRAPVAYPDLKISAQRRVGHEGDCCRDPMNCVQLDCKECSKTMNCEWNDGSCTSVACTVDHCGGAEVANSASGMAPACTCDCKAPAVGHSYCSIPSAGLSGCDYYTTSEASNQADYNILAACPNILRRDASGGNMVLQGDSCTPECVDLMSKWWVGRNCRCSTQADVQNNPSNQARFEDYDKIADLCGVPRPVCPDEKPERPDDCSRLSPVSCRAAQDEGYCIWDPGDAVTRPSCREAPADNPDNCLRLLSARCQSARPQDPNNPVQLAACARCGTNDHGQELTQAGCNNDIIGFWCLDQPVTCRDVPCPPGHMVGDPNQIRDFDSHKAGFGCCDRTCSGYTSCPAGEVLKSNLDTILESEGCCKTRVLCSDPSITCPENYLLRPDAGSRYSDEAGGCCVASCATHFACGSGYVKKPNAAQISVDDPGGCCQPEPEPVVYTDKRILDDCDEMGHFTAGSNQEITCNNSVMHNRDGTWSNCVWDENNFGLDDCDRVESGAGSNLGATTLLPVGPLPAENARPTGRHVWYKGLSPADYTVVDDCRDGCTYSGLTGDHCSSGCGNRIDKYGRVCKSNYNSGTRTFICGPQPWTELNAASMDSYVGGIYSTTN